MYAASQVSKRWLEQFSIPGYPAYEANQRALKVFGTGEQAPMLAVFTSQGRHDPGVGIKVAITGSRCKGSRLARQRLLLDGEQGLRLGRRTHDVRHDLPPGNGGFNLNYNINGTRKALLAATPAGVTAHLTGRDPLQLAEGGSGGPSVLIEALIGGLGALIILLFVFGTLPAVAMPILIVAWRRSSTPSR